MTWERLHFTSKSFSKSFFFGKLSCNSTGKMLSADHCRPSGPGPWHWDSPPSKWGCLPQALSKTPEVTPVQLTLYVQAESNLLKRVWSNKKKTGHSTWSEQNHAFQWAHTHTIMIPFTETWSNQSCKGKFTKHFLANSKWKYQKRKSVFRENVHLPPLYQWWHFEDHWRSASFVVAMVTAELLCNVELQQEPQRI